MTTCMTQAEELDVERFVALLNEDLGTEYQSIVQYINHIATITGAEFLGVIDELKLHLGQELSHAQVLAEQVSFLGGEPATTVPAVERASDSRLALKADLRLVTDPCNGPSTKSLLARSLLYRAARDLGNVQAAERVAHTIDLALGERSEGP